MPVVRRIDVATATCSSVVHHRFGSGVMVVGDDPESHNRDWEQKRIDYAIGKIPEYWIIDPQLGMITVLTLQGDTYIEHGVFTTGALATSKLLVGFAVPVGEVFAAAKLDD